MKQQDRTRSLSGICACTKMLTRYLRNRRFLKIVSELQRSPIFHSFGGTVWFFHFPHSRSFFLFSSPGSSPFLHDGYSSTSSNGRIFVLKQVRRKRKGKRVLFFLFFFFFFYSFHSIDPSFRTKRLIPVDPICSYSILFHV